MAERLSDGSIRLNDGRTIYANSLVLAQDLCELVPVLCPQVEEAVRAGAIFPGLFRGGRGGAVVGGAGFGGGGGGSPGPQGLPGPIGPPGPAGPPGPSTDIFASARVVSSDPAQGTDTTIQGAIDNLPAGGDIYVKPGTYVMPAALTSQPGPIKIHGSGIGSTILDFGAVAGAFILIQHDSTIDLEDLTVHAGGLPGQYLYDIGIEYLGTRQVILENVMVGRFGDPTKSIEGGFLGPIIAALTNVTILVQSTPASYFADAGALTPGSNYLVCYNVACNGIGAFRQRWGGLKNQTGLFVSQSLIGCANFSSAGYVFSCDGTSFVGGGGGSTLTASAFSVFTASYLNDIAVAPSFDVVITGCLSGIIYALVDRIVDIADGVFSVSVVGCNWASWAVETIRNGGTNVTVSACVGHFQKVTVTETGNADDNKYWDIADVGSTIIGPTSRIDGVLRTDVTGGATTDAFVTVVDHRNRKGIVGIGTVKNTGGLNSMSVRETVTDSFGVTSSATTVVAPGTDFLLNPQVNKGTARPSYVVYQVEVASTLAGLPTTYDLRHSTEGAML